MMRRQVGMVFSTKELVCLNISKNLNPKIVAEATCLLILSTSSNNGKHVAGSTSVDINNHCSTTVRITIGLCLRRI